MICIKISDCTQLETEAIMQNKYQQKYTEIFQQIGDHAKLVLATSLNNKVSARTMSFVILEGSLYFQTDKGMRKYQDIKGNPNVALCFSNIQLEGICEEIGRPIEHEDFCRLFQQRLVRSSLYPPFLSLCVRVQNYALYNTVNLSCRTWVIRSDII